LKYFLFFKKEKTEFTIQNATTAEDLTLRASVSRLIVSVSASAVAATGGSSRRPG
jgi:hypothetical protein